ncbi:lipid hydroperoxide peroxidase [Vagococcus penaei]|uniref:Lipid hydroperoxide peroxidase n=1 Tax=Vagococcus penaei TaxID=633807 RepID=A0A1Q2D7P7_9ENTE|nr:thiol peroxidase [Vagococcus penaei]AQP54389.1 lipid hydroperoxide peroxidase [Vagococcus penaei]RSU06305.1 lipid hydroperoxide peroxidase [Vagococcus penaei]
MQITLKGQPVDLEGVQPKVGDKAPNFTLLDLTDQVVDLSKLSDKPVLVSVVPDINTGVCQIQTKRFNEEASQLTGVHFLTISNNTKDEQASWCGAEGITMTMLRDTDLEFAKNYGLLIPAINRLARAVFVIAPNGDIVYEEIVPEVSTEPDFEQALAAINTLN